jgi:hypothetical protein
MLFTLINELKYIITFGAETLKGVKNYKVTIKLIYQVGFYLVDNYTFIRE